MRRIWLILIFSAIHVLAYAQELTIDIPEHRFRIDPYNHIIVVQSQDIEAYDDFSGYDGVKLTLTNFEYTFLEVPENLKYTGEYMVTNGSAEFHLFFTQLPLLKVETSGNITSGAKVPAQFLYADADQVLLTTAGISYRGNTSLWWSKKSFDLEFWVSADDHTSVDVQFANLRSDDDWVLDGMNNEPLRIRSITALKLWVDMHAPFYAQEEDNARSGAESFYVELFMNGRYKGIYSLGEQVDRQLIKAKHFDGAIRGEVIKGAETGPATMFTGLPAYNNALRHWGGFEMKYPRPQEATDWQDLYDFVDFVQNASDADFETEIWNRFNYANYLDYFIFLNLVRAPDNRGKNIYIAKYDTAYPWFYVPWDLDGVFGTIWNGTNENITDDILTNGFMDRVIALNPGNYYYDVRARWAELRQTVIQPEYLIDRFAYAYNLLKSNNVYARESLLYDSYPFDQAAFDYAAEWIEDRMAFLDIYFGYSPTDFQGEYQLFTGNQTRLFALESAVDDLNKIIAVEVDSVTFSEDSIYHFAPNWTFYPDDFSCMDSDGASRLGHTMAIAPDGTHYLYNAEGVPFELRTQAEVGDAWTAYSYPDGSGSITATVQEVNPQTVLGTEDQVKRIGLQKFDADSAALSTYIDTMYFEIGKNTGLIAAPEIRGFPNHEMIHLKGIQSQLGLQNLTYRDVMDFAPGDEIHVETVEQTAVAHVTYDVDRYLSRVDYPDSTVYQVERTTYTYEGYYPDMDLQPVDTVVLQQVITDMAGFDVYPATVVLANGPSSDQDFVWMNQGSHGTEKVFRHDDVVFIPMDENSPIYCGISDSQVCNNASKDTYIEGLGGPYYYCEGIWDSGLTWRRLKYYHKGDVTWGNSLISAVPHIDAAQISIFPNPASTRINIKLPNHLSVKQYRLMDLRGRRVLSADGSHGPHLDIASVAGGVYLLQIELTTGALISRKVVVSCE